MTREDARASASTSDAKLPLLLAGVACALGTYAAWRAKATNAFKASYALAWLTLGPAAILYAQPDRDELEKTLRAKNAWGVVSAEAREAQMRAMRGVAAGGEGARGGET